MGELFSLSQFRISLSRFCISLSQRRINYTRLVRWMSQICSTAVEHIFDGRRTKRRRLVWEVEVVVMKESIDRHVTYIVLVDYKGNKLTHKDNSLAFQKARKSEK